MSTHMGASGPPRFGGGPITTRLELGPLASLPGSWSGTGFNAIWRPDNEQSPENSKVRRFLELNLTSETLEFHVIPGVVPNRGLATQTDLGLYGLHYLQRISDADLPPFPTAGQALHIEPGLFMNVPASTSPRTRPHRAHGEHPARGHGADAGADPEHHAGCGAPDIPPIYPIPGLPVFDPNPPRRAWASSRSKSRPPGGDGPSTWYRRWT